MATATDWVVESKNDLAAAQNLAQAKLYAQACFYCQQAAEKILKAALLKSAGDFPKTHSLRQLANLSGLFNGLSEEISLLDPDYALTRYSDTYTKPPRAIYSNKSFSQRLSAANKIIEVVEEWMKK